MRFLVFLVCTGMLFSACTDVTLPLPLPLATEQRIDVGTGWAKTSINATVFRKNSVVTYHDMQFIAYYDKDGNVIVGRRNLRDKNWELKRTQYKGNVSDAHNVISLMADGDGYLHLAWNHHYTSLHYCRSTEPYGLTFTGMLSMTGNREKAITYPEFYRLRNGNLLFIYRDASSGPINIVVNSYDITTKKWSRLQNNLIGGDGGRSPYWQACIDSAGTIHISWVWRENSGVETNHDMCYARSGDGGKTWEKSTGEKYTLPIKVANAEYALHIPQQSDLINQTSMCADDEGHPYIATYFKDPGAIAPQYHIIYKVKDEWEVYNVGFRTKNFNLSGEGTRNIPISRPQIIFSNNTGKKFAAIIFRDEERGDKVSAAVCNDLQYMDWQLVDLTNESVGAWEPTYDTELWKEKGVLNLFIQKVSQGDFDGRTGMSPQKVWVLEWQP
ncbi:MAG TPA: BNR repeat-containing protein [Parafilimonas sp.]|nr:BNR repeat-containing protein [Parafilimonas sp.]